MRQVEKEARIKVESIFNYMHQMILEKFLAFDSIKIALFNFCFKESPLLFLLAELKLYLKVGRRFFFFALKKT